MQSIQPNIKPNTHAAVTLRRMVPKDVPAVKALAQRIWRAHYPSILSHDQIEYMLEKNYNEELLAEQVETGKYTLLACSDENVLGFISIVSQDVPNKYFISRFYTDTDYHGSGIGYLLLNQAIAEHAPVKKLSLNVNRQNIKAVNFYFRQGFTIEYCMDTDFGGGYFMNDFRMVRIFPKAN